jgi:gluconolactonase
MSSWRCPVVCLAIALLVGGPALAAGLVTVNPRSAYPEGPVVVGETLYYAEMGAHRVMAFDGKQNLVVWSREGCGPTSVTRAAGGALNVLCHFQGSIVRILPNGETLAVIDRDSTGRSFPTPNASVNDDKGGIFLSSSGVFAPDAAATGAILYLDRNDRLRRVAEGIHYANGVALTPDGGRLYVSEHLSRHVRVYDVAEDGTLSGGRDFVALDDLVGADPQRSWEVGPDGLAVDSKGNLYIAEYGAGRFHIVDPQGKLLRSVSLPERYVTALALADDERRIFVTAPVSFISPEAPGKVYSIPNPLNGGG